MSVMAGDVFECLNPIRCGACRAVITVGEPMRWQPDPLTTASRWVHAPMCPETERLIDRNRVRR